MDRTSDENRSFADTNQSVSANSSNTSPASAGGKLVGAKNHSQNMERVQRLIDSLADLAAQEIRQDLARDKETAKSDNLIQENAQNFAVSGASLGGGGYYDRPAPPKLLIKG